MKYKLRLFRGEVFATIALFSPPPTKDMIFTYQNLTYKTLEVQYCASTVLPDENIHNMQDKDYNIPLLTVVEIPSC